MSRIGLSVCGFDREDHRNYFPFSDAGGWDDVIGFPGPLVLPFLDMFEFCWRIKTLSCHFAGENFNGDAYNFTIAWPMWAFGVHYDNTTADYSIDSNPVLVETDIRCLWQQMKLRARTSDDAGSDTYSVEVIINWPTVNYDSGTDDFSTEIVTSQDAVPGLLTGITLFGRSVGPAGGGTNTLDITAGEWWAYDNGDGPIWNTATGARLIDPIPLGI